jgi:PBSX family phage terminase large subunit
MPEDDLKKPARKPPAGRGGSVKKKAATRSGVKPKKKHEGNPPLKMTENQLKRCGDRKQGGQKGKKRSPASGEGEKKPPAQGADNKKAGKGGSKTIVKNDFGNKEGAFKKKYKQELIEGHEGAEITTTREHVPGLRTESVQKLEKAFSMGLNVSQACGYAQVPRSTYYNYVKTTKDEKERLEGLRITPIVTATEVLLKAIAGNDESRPDILAARWYLEKRSREDYGSDHYVMELEKQKASLDASKFGYRGIPADLVAPEFANFFRDVNDPEHRFTHFRETGGRGGGRSTAISLAIVDLLMRNPELHALAVRQVKTTVRDSVFSQIIRSIGLLGLEDEFFCNRSLLLITRKETGQHIYFRGLDDPTKIKSIIPDFGYIGVLWVEECDQVRGGETSLRPVYQSLRGGDKQWFFQSWNTPRNKRHWINVRTTEDVGQPNVRHHHTTYLQLPESWIGRPFITEAENLKGRNENAYRHEYLGEAIGFGGELYQNISLETISDETISEFDNIKCGLDWGFAKDPLAFVKSHYDNTRKALYIFDEFVATGLTDDVVAKILKEQHGVGPKTLIFADSADPKSIENMRMQGLFVRPCTKFPGSVEHGVKFLQGLTLIVIDPVRCPTCAREFSNYSLKLDLVRNEYINVIDKKDDHTPDAGRYSLNMEIAAVRPARGEFVSAL